MKEESLTRSLGNPRSDQTVLVVAGVHGNETGGVRAIDRFLGGDLSGDIPRDNLESILEGEPEYRPSDNSEMRFMLANPGALERNRRSVDEDLVELINSGEYDDEVYESLLLPSIDEAASDADYILDLHESKNVGGEPVTVMNPGVAAGGRSAADPHAILFDFDQESVRLAQYTGLSEVRDYMRSDGRPGDRSGFFNYDEPTVVATETGPRGRTESAEKSYDIMTNVLGNLGVIDTDSESSMPEVYGIGNGNLDEYAREVRASENP